MHKRPGLAMKIASLASSLSVSFTIDQLHVHVPVGKRRIASVCFHINIYYFIF